MSRFNKLIARRSGQLDIPISEPRKIGEKPLQIISDENDTSPDNQNSDEGKPQPRARGKKEKYDNESHSGGEIDPTQPIAA